jgi:hypothetical protein
MGATVQGGKNTKKATRDLQQKRLDKKAEKDAARGKHSGIA